jgi:hypothetical protein
MQLWEPGLRWRRPRPVSLGCRSRAVGFLLNQVDQIADGGDRFKFFVSQPNAIVPFDPHDDADEIDRVEVEAAAKSSLICDSSDFNRRVFAKELQQRLTDVVAIGHFQHHPGDKR